MPLAMQVKLLRVLQEKRVRRVGAHRGDRGRRARDRRHQPARSSVWCGRSRFREDLFYRLNVIPIVLPPLRERREDIPLLAEHFLRALQPRDGQDRDRGSRSEAMERLRRATAGRATCASWRT